MRTLIWALPCLSITVWESYRGYTALAYPIRKRVKVAHQNDAREPDDLWDPVRRAFGDECREEGGKNYALETKVS